MSASRAAKAGSVPVHGTAPEVLKQAAVAARLRYATDKSPGIARVRTPGGFAYRHADGSKVVDQETLDRIRKLAIPPAYENVWICPHANGHLQAVGRDARGRKQYRYHPRWREVRDEGKYGKMLLFGKLLPMIRARVEQDLGLRGLPREKVLATVVRLLESTMMRVGNEEYARTNKSYGLTTLRNRHVKVQGSNHILLDFRGKRGTEYHIDLRDRRLATIVRRCQDLPGQELFQYLDEDGSSHPIGSAEVNDYLREITGEEITAKDFRTWAGTNLAALTLRELEEYDTQTKAKRNVVRAIEAVSKMLGNTPAICRKCYIHRQFSMAISMARCRTRCSFGRKRSYATLTLVYVRMRRRFSPSFRANLPRETRAKSGRSRSGSTLMGMLCYNPLESLRCSGLTLTQFLWPPGLRVRGLQR